MGWKALIPATVLCMLASGCGTIPAPRVTDVYCSISGPCMVPVRVDNCVISAPSISVPAAVNVYWNIDERSAAYQFPEDSLKSPGVWVDDDDPANPQFVEAARVTSYQFQLRDRHVSRKSYKYGVRVVRPDGTVCPIVKANISNGEFY